MNDKSIVDPYLQPRKSITKTVEQDHLLEVEGLCPLCGKNLLIGKTNGKSKLFEIAHIYPNSPTQHQVEELKG